MSWKKVLIAVLALVGLGVALWVGLLQLSKIDHLEVQTAAIAAVASLVGAVVGSLTSYVLERERMATKSKERLEDEQRARLNRYEEIQWSALLELEPMAISAGHFTADVLEERRFNKVAVPEKNAEIQAFCRRLRTCVTRVDDTNVQVAVNLLILKLFAAATGQLDWLSTDDSIQEVATAQFSVDDAIRVNRQRLTYGEVSQFSTQQGRKR